MLDTMEYLDLHRNRFQQLPKLGLRKLKTITKARLFNLNMIENSIDFDKILQDSKIDSLTKSEIDDYIFAKKNVILAEDKSFAVNATFEGNFLSSFKLKSDFRNFGKDFEFLNIPKTFSVIIGVNGMGKTGLLRLIEKITQLYLKQNNAQNYVSCTYYSSSRQTISNVDKNFDIDFKSISKAKIIRNSKD